ncbi:hypothetical protein EQG79_09175 [Spirosoma sordidisoli]|uniref:Uncharacterized protein n=2 Tax=Spirosoma sordidisoli TaxID=2502893 RepID=A0A4Q2UQE9_9BACT|nr:hypothetical protein EQG79_09175 [Spirosoma sordidisoli]
MNYYFLLGGHDLEMLTIRALLEEQRIPFSDRGLPWGASWTDYQDVIELIEQEGQLVVGVELGGAKPSKALLIDHHNEKAHLPSSLEQVATLLGVPLSRYQQLVSANDKGYIPAMRAIGATQAEIDHIRRLDRQAQGVTEAMEEQAEADIRLVNTKNNLPIVYTNLPKFSPIVDRLQEPRLLIYNAGELTYFGEHAAELATAFADDVAAGRAYYGGGPNGFFGIGKGHYNRKAIEQLVDRICTYLLTRT